MPDYPIIDTHVHLWDPRELRYPWLESVPALNRPFLMEEFRAACGPVEVDRLVFLQCDCEPAQFLREVEGVMRLRESDPRIAAIVAWAPVEQGRAAGPALDALAANPVVKGVRRITQGEPDPDFCLRPSFVEGVQLLEPRGLHFELCIHHGQLASSTELVRRCPGVRFMLDHVGKPDIRAGLLHPWKEEMAALARLPNVWCKVSGLATEDDHERWTAADLQPYVAHVIDCFGFDRLTFGSDWPVATLATDYARWVDTLESLLAGCTAEARRKLFRDNALAFYRL